MDGKKMNMVIKWLALQIMLHCIVAATATPSSNVKPRCRPDCGGVTVPYPFGINDPTCAHDKPNFLLNCTDSPSASQLWFGENILVHNISVEEGSIRVSFPTSFVCYNGSGEMNDYFYINVTLGDQAFTFSREKNTFVTFGCNVLGVVGDVEGKLDGSGCVSLCNGPKNISLKDPCEGVGCCETPITKGLHTLISAVRRFNESDSTYTYNPCAYAFLAEKDSINTSKLNLFSPPDQVVDLPVVLDWTVGRETCNASLLNSPGYACRKNTTCVNSTDGTGYRCSCKDGYRGNPYLDHDYGCQDINECKQPQKYTCHGTCKNTDGNYTCHCPFAKYGNAKIGPCEGLGIPGLAAGYACRNNTTCVNSTDGTGYRCSCKDGYRGNPYLDHDYECQDINECKQPQKYTCHGTCKNTDGNYTCHCPFAKYGNAKIRPCQGLGIPGLAAVVAAVVCSIVTIVVTIIGWKKRRREKYFKENGGLVLKNQRVKIFKQKELEKATNNYHESHLLGQGGSGSVYKGILLDGTQVAIKKPREVNKTQVMQDFQHEIGIISQVNHKHVVKLLGICLETKVPLLVYEYISNGTLFQHIHDTTSEILRPWKIRLRIAADIANALDYLHSLADPPIIHRDVKSLNILLDENYTAKVSDFGASVLNPLGKSSIITEVIGTHGYLDPEYLLTGELTIKSDVYSFGVVLLELLTGERPILIIQSFLSSIDDNIVFNNLKFGVTEEGEIEQIEVIVGLAKRCLNRSGKERPTMGEVAGELTRLIKVIDNFYISQQNIEETERLLGEPF